MKMKKSLIFIGVLISLSLTLRAQNVTDLIISEVMAENDSSIVDDYGRHNGWIEIMNTSQGTLNFGGCYFSDDRGNLVKSEIPKGDLKTKLGPRQVAVLFASGDSNHGTFYLDFIIRKGSTIYLTSNDGRTIIDSITVLSDLPADMTTSKIALDNKKMDFQRADTPTVASPMLVNGIKHVETGSQKLKREDPYGLILTLVSVTVVFAGLIILWFLYGSVGNIFQGKFKRKKAAKGMTPEVAAAISMALEKEYGGEVYAAIAVALNDYLNDTVHDEESFTITIKHAESAWADKSDSFRRLP